MLSNTWPRDLFSSETDIPPWELFHENSKLNKFSQGLSEEVVREQLEQFYESLPFESLPAIPLPKRFPAMNVPLRQALLSRVSIREMAERPLTVNDLAALLHFSYGINRDKAVSGLARSFRMAPSAGALYPLEIFFYSSRIVGLPPGIYHYNPCQHNLRLFLEGDQTQGIYQALVQHDVVSDSSLLIFITALFERSVFKYGERGYRFALLEAGHVAQNFNLVAVAMGLGSLNIGGYFDREIDELLGLDGITHSTIYMIAIGQEHT